MTRNYASGRAAFCRSADRASGLVSPAIYDERPRRSRFLQTDPVEGGSANDYDYVAADPINNLDLDGRMCFVKCGWRRAAGKVRDWAGSRNWGDYISGHINVYIGVGGIMKGYATMAASPLCGPAAAGCAAAGAIQTGMGVGRAWRGAAQVRRGVNRCTSHCSTRNQLIHAGLNLAPTPAGPLLRCRRGGCDNTWDAYSI